MINDTAYQRYQSNLHQDVTVAIGDMKMAASPNRLVTYALGSCVGMTFYNIQTRQGALLHILLPERTIRSDGNIMKYADTAIPATARALKSCGFVPERTVVKMAGGACMLSGKAANANIGDRNIESCREFLKKEGFTVSGEDVGGFEARTMRLDCITGIVSVSRAGGGTVIL